jgi:hypothetical protein
VKRDLSRRQVYIAEEASLAGTAFMRAPGATVLSAAIDEVAASTWWSSAVGVSPVVTFADNQGSGFYRHADRRIHLGRSARWLVAAHELSHMAASHADAGTTGSLPHGDQFCWWEVTMFRALFGEAAARLLHAGFTSLGLALAIPSLDVPPPSTPIWGRYVDTVEYGGWQAPRPPPSDAAPRAIAL